MVSRVSRQADRPRGAGRPAGNNHDTRSLIVDTASDLLTERGVDGLSNKLICELCAITPPTLYHYFSDKNALLDALVSKSYADFFASKVTTPKSCDPVERFKDGLRDFVKFGVSKPEHFKLMASATVAGRTPELLHKSLDSPMADLKCLDDEYGLRVSIEVAAQLTVSAAFGACILPISSPEIPWTADLSEIALDAIVGFLLKNN